MKFKALRRAVAAATLTTACVAIMVVAVEHSLTAVGEPFHDLAQGQEVASANG